MRLQIIAIAIVCWGASSLQAQTLQLPTFNFSTVNTTVSVPDRGGMVLGGVGRASEGITSRGVPGLGKLPGANRLFNNNGIGRSIGGQTHSVHVTIIDNREIDEALLAQAAAIRAARGEAYAQQLQNEQRAYGLSQQIAGGDRPLPVAAAETGTPSPLPTAAEIQAANAVAARQRSDEAVRYFEQGKLAEASGKKGAAKIYYNMALRRAAGELREATLARISALESPSLAER